MISPELRGHLPKGQTPLLTGQGRYAADIRVDGVLHAFVVRSVRAHATIGAVTTADAKARPGVVTVITSEDLPRPIPYIPIRQFSLPGMDRYLQPPLATDRVRYVGEPIAVVVASSRYLAEDAAQYVDVDYEDLPFVGDAESSATKSSARLFEATDTNVAGRISMVRGDVAAAFNEAPVVVEALIKSQRHAAFPLETRGVVAEPTVGGRLTVWGAAKIPHVNRRILAALLERSIDSIRLVESDVGGGFGSRGEFYPEDYLVPFIALRLGRPVSWIEDRLENLRASNHSREQSHRIAIALTAEGKILGLKDHVLNDTGAYIRTHGMTVAAMSASLLYGPYDWPAYSCEALQVMTNKTPAGTYRAPGRFEANFARERIMDMAAHRIGLHPVEFRARNLIRREQMPYNTQTETDGHPVVYEVGDYPLLLQKAMATPHYREMVEWRAASGSRGRRRGLGLAMFVEKSGIGVEEYARVEINAQGLVTVYSGVASVGQGIETALAEICSQYLGVAFDQIQVVHGDTDVVPEGMGAFGSRATMLGGAAVMRAATSLRQLLLAKAANTLGVSTDILDVVEDRIAVRQLPDRNVPLAALMGERNTSINVEERFHCSDMSFPYGVHIASVDVDAETGHVKVDRYLVAYDVGRAINPRLVHGQILGGIAQGVGGALLEELSYDSDGQLVSGTFADYLLPSVNDMPSDVGVLITEDTPTPLNPLGAKGAGEAGVAAAGAAIANAVSDALGVEVLELPLSPQRVQALAAKADGKGHRDSDAAGSPSSEPPVPYLSTA